MDAERALISKVAHTGRGAVDLMVDGMTADLFASDDCREVWEFIVAHQGKYGKQPTVPTILERFKHFNFELSEEPLDYIRERFIESVERRETIDFARMLAVACNEPEFAGKLADLILEKGRDLNNLLPGARVAKFGEQAAQRVEKYIEQAASGTPYTGLKMGIPDIDDATLGIQDHELISVVGWQGTGKSTLVQWILANIYMQGKVGMYISLEMTAEALMRKWDQMFQEFTSYRHLKMLNLSDAEVKKWQEWASKAKETQADIIVLADGGSWTVERVHGEILKHRPDVVAIDYLSLMESGKEGEERWASLTKLTRALKQVALQTHTPIIAISQTNRDSAKEGAKMDNIGGSYSVGADSDIVIGLHQDDEKREFNEMEVRLIKNRDGEMISTDIYWDMKTMRFADSFALEQVRKTRAATELATLIEKGLTVKVNEETGEIIEVEEPEKPTYQIGSAAATITEEEDDAVAG